MKTYRSKRGPLAERPYYTSQEIEDICASELRGVGLYPQSAEAIRIDRFIEKRFSVVHAYEDLGEGILGQTRFGPKGVSEVIVARVLDQDTSRAADRRVRSTLAHEAGHGLLHSHLFAISRENFLFGEVGANLPTVLCREEGKSNASTYKGEWWEFQANQAMSALLLPRGLVESALGKFMKSNGKLGFSTLDQARKDDAARERLVKNIWRSSKSYATERQ
jgi:hypothetical protein